MPLSQGKIKLRETEEQRCKLGWNTTSRNLRAALCKDSQKGSSRDKMNFGTTQAIA